MKNYQPVIGLEIHVELKTQAKMFCQCPANYFGKKPNTQVCPVCLGLPGALPVPNQKAVEWTVLLGKALNCRINKVSKFDRKHYFYPDLPKGYQISQYDEPIAVKGKLSVISYQLSGKKEYRIRRVHLEEDTGKLIHSGSETLIDFNRCGVPLVEIVTEPDFENSDDVKRFLEEIQVIIRYLGISDCDMEKGTMRLEPNVSVRPVMLNSFQHLKKKEILKQVQDDKINQLPKYKVEIKNINSFRFVKQAIDYEVKRQIELLEKGQTPIQETRGFDEKRGVTYSQRTKEEAHDYRYFPEPDIPIMVFSSQYIHTIEKQLPELPQQKVDRYVNEMSLRYQDAFVLTRDRKIAEYYEGAISKLKSQMSKLKLKTQNLNQSIANLIINKKISTDLTLSDFVKRVLAQFGKKEVDEEKLNQLINQLIKINKKAVEDYKKGKQNAVMFLVGQVMKELRGEADAQIVRKKLEERLRNI